VRAFGREAFEREIARTETLSAFLLSSLKGRSDLSTLEGRSRLLADAKPLLRRITAAGLRVQLVRTVADIVAMSPIEVARLTGLPDGTIVREERAPQRVDRAAAATDGRFEREVLACVLAAPELAGRLDVKHLDTNRTEGRAIVEVMAFLRTEPEVRSVGGVLEAFRGSEHERALAAAERILLDLKLDADTAAIVLQDAQANLLNRRNKTRHSELRERIDTGLATPEEQTEFARLSVSRSSLSSAG
jgi:DNA primase